MTNNWQPQWTTQVKIESGGRHPLGLNAFHDGLDEILIKSITVGANRLRYITYCCWAIGNIEDNEKCTEYSDFVEAFRRRENAMSLGVFLLAPSYSVPGSTAISKILYKKSDKYNCSFDLMQSNELGAFGLYYKGTMYNLGLTESDEDGILLLTKLGRSLYEIAESYYGKLRPAYWRRYAGQKTVPTKILKEWGVVNDFENIRKPACKEEREFYKKIIYRLEKKDVTDYRRDTFTFLMECIDMCSKNNAEFNENVLRNIHYYSCFYENDNKIGRYKIPSHFNVVCFYWLLYEGHVYFRWWLDLYFDTFLQFLKASIDGATIDDYFSQIDKDEFNTTIRDFCGQRKNYYDGGMKSIIALFPKPSKLNDRFSEESLHTDEDHTTTSCILAKFILMIINLFTKYKALRSDRQYQYILAHLGSDLWFDVVFHFSNLENITVKDFLRIVLKRYIIEQHDSIMIKKEDLRRRWFTTENKKYFFEADVSPIRRPAKYETIMNYLSDMNLINESKDGIKLSKDGQIFLKHLITEYY